MYVIIIISYAKTKMTSNIQMFEATEPYWSGLSPALTAPPERAFEALTPGETATNPRQRNTSESKKTQGISGWWFRFRKPFEKYSFVQFQHHPVNKLEHAWTYKKECD